MKHFYKLIIILSLLGCKKEQEIVLNHEIEYIEDFKSSHNVELTEVKEYSTITPFNITITDSSVYFMDISEKSDYVFHEFNLKSKELSNTYFTLGSGPNEFIAPFSGGVENNTLWAYDFTINKIVEMKFSEKEKKAKEYKLKDLHGWLAKIDSTHYIATGNRDNSEKLQLININSGEIIKNFGDYKFIPSNLPIEILKQIYQNLTFTHPNKKKAVSIYRFTDAIEIFDLQKFSSKVILGPERIKADFEETKLGDKFLRRTENTKQAFIFGVTTKKLIYALYSGEKVSDPKSQKSNIIYVYDWDGKPIKKLNLNKKIISFGVSENDSLIYSFDIEKGQILEGKL